MSMIRSSTRRHCPECNDDYQGDGAYCLVCGASIILIPNAHNISGDNISHPEPSDENSFTSYLDLFGIDFQDILQRFNSSSINRVISQDYASTLGKIDVNERFSVLFNHVIRIGPLKVNSVPATFSSLYIGSVVEVPLVIANPICGETPFVNVDQMKGSLALMERGVVSFAQKCKHAIEAGAVGVIVAQNSSKWPFVMDDSSAELGGESVDIPVCMVSQTDGELLFKWVRSKVKDTSHISCSPSESISTHVKFKCDELPRDCSVCQDDMKVGDNVLRLSCCHTFHSECIMTWLHKNNNCPMCRHEMPSVAAEGNGVGGSQRRVNASHEQAPNHRQNYFA